MREPPFRRNFFRKDLGVMKENDSLFVTVGVVLGAVSQSREANLSRFGQPQLLS